MADVAFVPECDILQRGDGISPHHPGESAQAAPPVMGLRLCGMAELPFWPGTEEFLRFQYFGALQMPQLRRPAIDARGDEREVVENSA